MRERKMDDMENNKEKTKKGFYEHMKKAIGTSLNYLKKRSREEAIPLLHDYDITVDLDKKRWNIIPQSYYSMSSFVGTHMEEILGLPTVIRCVDFMF